MENGEEDDGMTAKQTQVRDPLRVDACKIH